MKRLPVAIALYSIGAFVNHSAVTKLSSPFKERNSILNLLFNKTHILGMHGQYIQKSRLKLQYTLYDINQPKLNQK